MNDYYESIVRRLSVLTQCKHLNVLGKFSVVTMPTNVDNEISAILQPECDIRSLISQVMGGLEPRSIALITNDMAHAENVADKLMTGIENADQEIREYAPVIPRQLNKPRSKR